MNVDLGILLVFRASLARVAINKPKSHKNQHKNVFLIFFLEITLVFILMGSGITNKKQYLKYRYICFYLMKKKVGINEVKKIVQMFLG